MSVEVLSSPGSTSRVVGTYNITDRYANRLKRPRSTPAHGSRPVTQGHIVPGTASSGYTENGVPVRPMHRPKTAAAVLGMNRDCDRVSQLEHERTRRHNFESHTPVKKNRPPPWQKNIDPPLVPFVVGPGYILSKSKSKFAVTLKDEFFDPVQDEEVKKKHGDPERDNLISQLQDRISDLSLYLEEERLNHKQTKQKGEEFLKDKVDELENSKKNALAEKDREHLEEMEKMKKQMTTEYNNYKTTAEGQISRMKKEIEFLQGAFESYKTSLHQETDDKWNRKQADLMNELEAQKDKEIHELKLKIIQDKNMEKAQQSKDSHRAIDNLRKEHKRELDSLVRKFSNVAADLERLKKAEAELEETKSEYTLLKQSYNSTCSQLAHITRELTDTKVRLMTFEDQFETKVQEVDDRYKQKIDDLMTQNTELKRLYVGKCGELYEEKVLFERDRVDRVMKSEEIMHKMLHSKHKAEVSLHPGIKEVENKERTPKTRPGSAPTTNRETVSAALSAGELDHLKLNEEEEMRPTVLLPKDSEEVEEMRRTLMLDIKQMSKEDLMKSVSDTVS